MNNDGNKLGSCVGCLGDHLEPGLPRSQSLTTIIVEACFDIASALILTSVMTEH